MFDDLFGSLFGGRAPPAEEGQIYAIEHEAAGTVEHYALLLDIPSVPGGFVAVACTKNGCITQGTPLCLIVHAEKQQDDFDRIEAKRRHDIVFQAALAMKWGRHSTPPEGCTKGCLAHPLARLVGRVPRGEDGRWPSIFDELCEYHRPLVRDVMAQKGWLDLRDPGIAASQGKAG